MTLTGGGSGKLCVCWRSWFWVLGGVLGWVLGVGGGLVMPLMFGGVLVGVLENILEFLLGVFGPVFVGCGACWFLVVPCGF